MVGIWIYWKHMENFPAHCIPLQLCFISFCIAVLQFWKFRYQLFTYCLSLNLCCSTETSVRCILPVLPQNTEIMDTIFILFSLSLMIPSFSFLVPSLCLSLPNLGASLIPSLAGFICWFCFYFIDRNTIWHIIQ